MLPYEDRKIFHDLLVRFAVIIANSLLLAGDIQNSYALPIVTSATADSALGNERRLVRDCMTKISVGSMQA